MCIPVDLIHSLEKISPFTFSGLFQLLQSKHVSHCAHMSTEMHPY